VTALTPAPNLWEHATQALANPVRVVSLAFVAAITAGTALLMSPWATAPGETTTFVKALFTATSAVCVTGLVVVDTGEHWTTFGQVVILALFQIGGFGVMTLGSMLVLLIGGRLGVRTSMLSEVEKRHGDDEGSAAVDVILGVLRTSLLFEAAIALVLIPRLALGHGVGWGQAAWEGVFHAVSAFNNAGFVIWPGSLEGFVTDPWITVPISIGVFFGALGFPVLWELRREWRLPRMWSLHTKVTMIASVGLLLLGWALLTAVEWGNRATFGPLAAPHKVVAGFVHSVQARSGGFNSVPVGEMESESLLALDVLMFIGGGSAGTGGGIKVTTFVLLGFVIWAELRGERRVAVHRRQLPPDVQRQALTVALLSVGAVMASTWALLVMSDDTLDRLLFEAISAFGTVGLSTGVTPDLPPAAHVLLTVLMFAGRLGPITLGAALALRSRPRLYTYPEERPIVG
jgi:trk system potassium uptake protein TrkH